MTTSNNSITREVAMVLSTAGGGLLVMPCMSGH
jgi:hypothetical protein